MNHACVFSGLNFNNSLLSECFSHLVLPYPTLRNLTDQEADLLLKPAGVGGVGGSAGDIKLAELIGEANG